MLINNHLNIPGYQNISYPLKVLNVFSINPLSFFWLHTEHAIMQINAKYGVYENQEFKNLWEWEIAEKPSSVFFSERFLIVKEERETLVYEKETGTILKKLNINSHLNFIYNENGLILKTEKEQDFLAKVSLSNLMTEYEDDNEWMYPIDNTIFWHNILYKDRLILNLEKKHLLCLNWQTGEKLWEVDGDVFHKNLIHNIFNTRQVIWKDSIISAYSEIISLDIHTGEKKWQKPFRIGVNGASVDSLGRLYALTHSKYLVLEAESGDVVLEKPIQEVLANFDYSEIDFQCPFPAVTDQHIIFSNLLQHLLFVNKFTGEVEWSHHFEGAKQVGHPLKVENGRLFLVVDHQLVVMEEVKKPI